MPNIEKIQKFIEKNNLQPEINRLTALYQQKEININELENRIEQLFLQTDSMNEEILEDYEESQEKTVIIGNGDVFTKEQIKTFGYLYGIDGLMIGRGIFQDITLFNQNNLELNIDQRIDLLKLHVLLWQETWQIENLDNSKFRFSKNFALLKKYFKIYISNFPGSSELRVILMECNSPEEVIKILDEYKQQTNKVS